MSFCSSFIESSLHFEPSKLLPVIKSNQIKQSKMKNSKSFFQRGLILDKYDGSKNCTEFNQSFHGANFVALFGSN